jgi:hypothetical protein
MSHSPRDFIVTMIIVNCNLEYDKYVNGTRTIEHVCAEIDELLGRVFSVIPEHDLTRLARKLIEKDALIHAAFRVHALNIIYCAYLRPRTFKARFPTLEMPEIEPDSKYAPKIRRFFEIGDYRTKTSATFTRALRLQYFRARPDN